MPKNSDENELYPCRFCGVVPSLLEQLEEFLEHLVNDKPLEPDTSLSSTHVHRTITSRSSFFIFFCKPSSLSSLSSFAQSWRGFDE